MENTRTEMSERLAGISAAALVLIPLDELFVQLQNAIGPWASEALEILVNCVFVEEPDDGRAPLAFRRLHRMLCNQGFERFEAEAIMREAYGKMLTLLDMHVPGWAEEAHYEEVGHWMHSHCTLALQFKAERKHERARRSKR